ncbi:MAG: lycopene cyclase domain-containing protein [Verrucomicrobiota bacterium]
MSYFRFHLVFTLPLLGVLLLAGAADWKDPCVLGTALFVLVPVMLFTTPWDNYAAKCGIWGFSEGQYSRKIGYLPVEEYLFFIIQSLQAMALTVLVLQLGDFQSLGFLSDEARVGRLISGGIGLVIFLALGLVFSGKWRHQDEGKWHYTWHLFFWFLPVVALQWWIAPDVLIPRWPVLIAVTFLLGSYLSWADWMAIQRNIWFFDHKQTTGVNIGGKMPWEEAAFFYLTSLLVCQSFLILLPEALRI